MTDTDLEHNGQARDEPLRIISVDDHLVEPPQLWVERLPKRYRDVGPRVERDRVLQGDQRGGKLNTVIGDPDGLPCDVWAYEDLRVPIVRVMAAMGFPRDDMGVTPTTYDEIRPGCFKVPDRLSDMDVNGVEAAMCFPNMFVRFCGQTFLEAKDRELAGLCVKAYNDFVIEEWAAPSSGRLIPICIVPLWDPVEAAAEVRRNAERGCRAVTFSEMPPELGLPSIHSGHWEPLMQACAESGTVINLHIGSSSKLPHTSDDAPGGITNALCFLNCVMAAADWLMSGAFIRHPSLKVALSESQIGWLPYLLQRIDQTWETRPSDNDISDVIPEPPSTYFHSNMYCAFFDDIHGIRNLDTIGVDRVLFETDYPHADSTWPTSQDVVAELIAEVGRETAEKIVRGNAIEMLGLELPVSG